MTNNKKAFFALVMASAFSSAQALTLGVTEGVTYRATEAEIEAKFAPIAKMISLATKQPVKIQIIPSYNALRDALKQGQLDAAFIHRRMCLLNPSKPALINLSPGPRVLRNTKYRFCAKSLRRSKTGLR